jgi:hypothetical protein
MENRIADRETFEKMRNYDPGIGDWAQRSTNFTKDVLIILDDAAPKVDRIKALFRSFMWSQSEQGSKYWDNVYLTLHHRGSLPEEARVILTEWLELEAECLSKSTVQSGTQPRPSL